MPVADPTEIPGRPAGATPGKSYENLAIGSLVCAIFVFAPLGLIVGLIARRKMMASNNFAGWTVAMAGIVIGAIGTLIYIVALVVYRHSLLLSDRSVWLGALVNEMLPLYLILQIWFGLAWFGRWRIAALVPLIAFVPLLGVAVAGLIGKSNLWPLPPILFAPLGFAYLLILGAARAIVRRRAAA